MENPEIYSATKGGFLPKEPVEDVFYPISPEFLTCTIGDIALMSPYFIYLSVNSVYLLYIIRCTAE